MEKKAMISQPMNGLSDEEILATKERAVKLLESKGFYVPDTFFQEDYRDDKDGGSDVLHPGVFYLAKSLIAMSFCDAVYFCKGWEGARGCRMEHEVAKAYGLNIIYEE